MIVLLLVLLALAPPICAQETQLPADLVLRGGKIVSLDSANPEAKALAARDGVIVAVGTEEEIAPLIGEATRVIELGGRLVLPGFIDSHAHFIGLGKSKMMLDLRKARSWSEIVAQVKQAAETTPRGSWITARGWHQDEWEVPPAPRIEGLPVHDLLSAATPHHPVLLTHASGHMAIVNRKAMDLAGIHRGTADPEGGEIVRTTDGDPTGVLRETAEALVAGLRERSWTEDEVRRAIELSTAECLSYGITTLHDAGATFREIDLYREIAARGTLGIRLWVMIDGTETDLPAGMDEYRTVGYAGGMLTVRAVKMYIDGALGSHGAWLFQPYEDLPGRTGDNTIPLGELARIARLALQKDFQLCTHAIGDRANHEVLEVYGRAFNEFPGKKDLRWRIEHAQHLRPADIPRFASLGIIAVMQGIHCTSDASWVITRLGETRAREGAYAWRSLLDAGVMVTNGTDAPVENIDPIPCIYASVSRRLPDGSAFFPEQSMSRMEAIRSYTTSGAFAAFEEHTKGSLSPGKLADITVLSRDITSIPEEEIPGTIVLYTILGGKVVYEHEGERKIHETGGRPQ